MRISFTIEIVSGDCEACAVHERMTRTLTEAPLGDSQASLRTWAAHCMEVGHVGQIMAMVAMGGFDG